MRLGVAFSQAVLVMRQHYLLSAFIFSVLLPSASVLPQAADSTPRAALKSKAHTAQWTEADEKALLAKAQCGDAVSRMRLGTAYDQGWFGKTDFQAALNWFRRSAEQGDADAQDSLGTNV